MRKGLAAPRTLDDLITRVQNALFQISVSGGSSSDETRVRARLTYRADLALAHLPKWLQKEIRRESERLRKKLSARVERRFARTQRISLVAALIMESPTFLREKWVADLLVGLKVKVLTGADRPVRDQALADLTTLANAIVSVRLPTGASPPGKKTRPLSAASQPPGIMESLSVMHGYRQYLEIGTCLKALRSVADDERARSRAVETRKSYVSEYAEKLGVPESWIADWSPSMKPHVWARERMAERLGTTPEAVRRRVADADQTRKGFLEVVGRSNEATQRLSGHRKEKAIERMAAGGSGIQRRY